MVNNAVCVGRVATKMNGVERMETYKITVNKNVFESQHLGRRRTPGFSYVVFGQSERGSDKLATVTNKSLYDALDEGLSVLLTLLAQQDKQAIVKIGSLGQPFTEGGKTMLLNKYTAESQFLAISFE